MPIGPGGLPLPYGPQGAPGSGLLAGNPYAAFQPPKEPIQQAGEDAITKLLQMASSSPQLLLGLSMAGAAREISQLTGMSRRRGGGTAGQGRNPAGAAPSAAALLGGNVGDLDRLIALQSMIGGGGAPPGVPPAGGMLPGGATPPMGGMPGGVLPPQFAGLV